MHIAIESLPVCVATHIAFEWRFPWLTSLYADLIIQHPTKPLEYVFDESLIRFSTSTAVQDPTLIGSSLDHQDTPFRIVACAFEFACLCNFDILEVPRPEIMVISRKL